MKIIQKLRTYLINKLDKHNEELFKISNNYRSELRQCDQRLITEDNYLRDIWTEFNSTVKEELVTEPYPKNSRGIPEPQDPLFWKIHHKSWALVSKKLEDLVQINLKERNELHTKFNNDIADVKDRYSVLERASLLTLVTLRLSERWNSK